VVILIADQEFPKVIIPEAIFVKIAFELCFGWDKDTIILVLACAFDIADTFIVKVEI
jgi:hypothetical protein